MTKGATIGIRTVEAPIGLAAFLLAATGMAARLVGPFPQSVVCVAGLPTLILFALAARAWRSAAINLRTSLWLTILVITGVRLATPPTVSTFGLGEWGPAGLMFYAVAVLFGATGEAKLLLAVLLTVFLGEATRVAAGLIVAVPGGPIRGDDLARYVGPLVDVGCVCVAGLSAFLAASGRPRSPSGVGVAANIAPDTKVLGEETDLITSKTGVFSLEYLSELKNAAGTRLEDLLSSVVYFMGRNFKAYSALGFIYEPSTREFVLNSFTSKSMAIAQGVRVPVGQGIVGSIGAEKRSFMSGDITNYDRGLQYYTSNQMINSVLAVPIISDRNELLGALVIDSRDRSAFKDQHKETLKRFSTLAAALITNVRMRVHQEMTARQFQLLYSLSQRFTSALETDAVLGALLELIPQMANCVRATAVTFDPGEGRGVVRKIVGATQGVREGMSFPVNDGLYSYVYRANQPLNVGDLAEQSTRYYRFIPDEPADLRVRSLLFLPFADDQDRCLGVVAVESEVPNQFQGETEQILTMLVSNASVAYIRALLYQKMVMLATTDGLTLLSNHRTFQENLAREIHRAQRYGRPLSLLLMDIDHFKKFNDTYGHPVGDLVLREIAGCIRRSVRVNDFPARYGGEEFAVVVPETEYDGALITAERIRTTIESHAVDTGKESLKVTVSIGCAALPAHADTQQELIDCADKALYQSKETGRNRVTIYSRKT